MEKNKMIHHILLFKFEKETTDEDITKIMLKFEECKNKLSGFLNFIHGRNTSIKTHLSKGFNYGAIMSFDNNESIMKYNELPEHKEAQELQKPFLEEVLVYNIEY